MYVHIYGVLILGGEELEEVKSVHNLEIIFGSKLTFETHLREVVPKTARSTGGVYRAEKSFDCRCVLKCSFNAYVLPNLEHCAPVWTSSAEAHLSLLESVVRLYDLLHEYLHHFAAARNARGSAALCKLALVIPRCETDQFSQSFLPVAVKLAALDVFSGGSLSFFESALNLWLERA